MLSKIANKTLFKSVCLKKTLNHPLVRSTFANCNVNSLHRFGEEIESKVMNKMQTEISKPTLRPTKEREAYSETHDKTAHCNGCVKCDNWERDIPLMTIQEAIREAYRCLKCNDAPC